MLAMLLVASPALAQSLTPEWRAGGELGLLMRQEAGGQRTPLPALTARLSYDHLPGPLAAGLSYQFAFAREGTVVRSFTQHHRLHLRPQVSLPLGTAFFSLGAGPGLQLSHSSVADAQRSYGALVSRWCAGAELAFGVRLGRTQLRTGVDVTYAPGRLDLVVGMGASFGWGDPR